MYSNMFTKFASSKASQTDMDAFGDDLMAQGDMIEAANSSLSATLGTLDAMDARLEHDKSEGSVNMAMAVIDGITGGAASAQLGFSMESMDANDLEQPTLNGLGDMVKKAWEELIKFIKNLIKGGRALMSSLSDKMPGLKKKAEKLKDKADEVSGSPEERKIKIGGAFSKLALVNKKVDVGAIVNVLKEMSSVKHFLEDSVDVDELLIDIDDLVKGDKIDALFKDVQGVDKLPDNLAKSSGSEYGMALTNDIPGNTSVAMVANGQMPGKNDRVPMLKYMASLKVKFVKTDSKLKLDDTTEVETLSGSDVGKLCDAVISVADSFERKGRKEIKKELDEMEKVTKHAEDLSKKVDKEEYKEHKAVINAYRSLIQNTCSESTATDKQLYGYVYNVATAALSYGEKSLAQYKDD